MSCEQSEVHGSVFFALADLTKPQSEIRVVISVLSALSSVSVLIW